MKNLMFWIILFLFCFCGIALAQDVTVAPEQIVTAAGKAIDDWQHYGWVAGMIAVAGALILALRLPIVDKLLEKYNLKRFKPLASAVLGGATGMLSTLATGANLPQSLLAGVVAGFAATGMHQAVTQPIEQAMPSMPKDKLPPLT